MARTLTELRHELRPSKPLSADEVREAHAGHAQGILVSRILALGCELRADPDLFRHLSQCNPGQRQRIADLVRHFIDDLTAIPTEIDELTTEAGASSRPNEIGSTSK